MHTCKLSSSFLNISLATAALCSVNLLTGCAAGNLPNAVSPVTATRTTTNITGTVHGGQQPIGGSLVQLWETGGGTAGAAATASATVTSGQITAITLITSGSGYTSAPSVTMTDANGSGATAAAVLSASDGTIASITVSSGGSGYTNPSIKLNGGIAPNGYGMGAIQLVGSTTTAAGTGAFSFPAANVSTNCKTGPYTYITANGGDPSGTTAGNVNPAIELVAVLGTCASTGSSTNVNMNELTTVAAAYALSNFATDNTGTINIGAPISNSQGMSDAIANALLLVNSSTGVPTASTATMVLPSAMINSLGNVLASCINVGATGGATSCNSLFSYTTPPGGATPTDTFQAALNMAKYPGNNVSSILNLATAAAPFQPGISVTTANATTAPNDLTLGISYPNTTMQSAAYKSYSYTGSSTTQPNGPFGLTIDANDNVWTFGATNGSLTTDHYNYISELTSPSSTPVYTSTLASTATLDATHVIRTGAFDTNGNLWLSDKNITSTTSDLIEIASGAAIGTATELTSFTGVTLPSGNAGSLDPNDWWVAIDASNNLWTASYGAAGKCTTGGSGASGLVCDYVEYVKGGTAMAPTWTPTASFNSNAVGIPMSRGGIVDTTSTAGLGNVWATAYGVYSPGTTAGTFVEVLTPSTGAAATITLGSTAAEPQGVALDAAGNGWITTNATAATSGLWKIPQGTATGTISSAVPTTGPNLSGIATTSSLPASNAKVAIQTGGLNLPGYDAVDGAGNIWVANYTYGTTVEYSPSQIGYLSPYYGFSPSLTTASVTATASQVSYAASGNANIYGANNVAVGQTVTLSGFGSGNGCVNGGPYTVTALGATPGSYFSITGTSCAASSGGAVTATGTITVNPSTQSVFTCSGSTVTCGINAGQVPSNNYIAIDRAGTVWSMNGVGTITGIIGTAAPTNPVLASGAAGSLPQ